MQDAARLALAAGFSTEKAATIVAIAWAESRGNIYNCNNTGNSPTDSWDRGILQLNDHWHPVSNECAFSAECSFSQALSIRFSDWTTYTGGQYRTFLESARAAVVQVVGEADVSIVTSSISPAIANPGDVIRFNFGISHNFQGCSEIRLGAQIRLALNYSSTSNPWIDDMANDVVIGTCGASSRPASRNFRLPSNLTSGYYDIHWVLIVEGSGRWFDDVVESSRLHVIQPGDYCPVGVISAGEFRPNVRCIPPGGGSNPPPPTAGQGISYTSDAFGGQRISLYQDSGRKIYFLGASAWCFSINGYAFGPSFFGPLAGQLIGDRCYFDFSSSSDEFIYFNYQNRSAIWIESPEGTTSGGLVVVRDSQDPKILNVRIPKGSGGGTTPPAPGPPPTPSTGGIVYASDGFSNSKISLHQESGRRLYFLGATQWCTSIEGHAFGGNANNSGPIRGQSSGDHCIMDFSSSVISSKNDTIWFRFTDGRAIWVESAVGTRSGDLVVGSDKNVRIPVTSSGGTIPPPPGNPPPTTTRGNFAVQHPDSPSWESAGYWNGSSTVTMYEFDCDFFGIPALLWVSGPNKWQSFTGYQQGGDCVFSVSNISSQDKVAIGFDTSVNKAWYIFSRAGTCTRIADDHGWMYLTPNCFASASAQEPRALDDIRPSVSLREVVFDLTDSQLLNWQVQIFDLSGRRVFEGGANTFGQVRWSLTTHTGTRVPNGVYLYLITVKGPNGEIKRSQVKKLAVVR